MVATSFRPRFPIEFRTDGEGPGENLGLSRFFRESAWAKGRVDPILRPASRVLLFPRR